MRRISIGIALVFIACGQDADSVQVLRAWSDDGTAHYDLMIDGVARHVARTPRSVGATMLVSDAAGVIGGAAQYENEAAYVLDSDPQTLASEMPDDFDGASAYALELALAGELPDVDIARLDALPDTMPTTCVGRCGQHRTMCVAGQSNLTVIALCDWWYRQCVDLCQPVGGIGSGGVWIP